MSNKPTDPVLTPNLGLYLDRPRAAMKPRMLSSCLNIRIKEGEIRREQMGWATFPDGVTPLNLDGRPVELIENFFPTQGGQVLVFGNTTDLFEWDDVNSVVRYLTPRYETGTVGVTNGSVTVTGTSTAWSTNLKAGDFFHPGATGQRDPAASWYQIASVDSDTQITLSSAVTEATQSGIAYTARQAFTGDKRDYWRTVTFPRGGGTLGGDPNQPDRMYMSNGIDKVVAWDSASSQVYVPNLGNIASAKTLARYKNMLVLGNISDASGTKKPYSIRNSAIGEPENHTSKEAAEYVVHDGVDPILTMLSLGDTLVVYAERSVILVSYVGDPFNFAFRSAVGGVGPIAGRAVADYGDVHSFLGPDAQYEFDGVNIRETGYHVWRDVLRQHSPQRIDAFLSHFDEENGEVLWACPLNTDADTTNGAPENAYVEHYLELVGQNDPTPVTYRDLPATATGYFQREKTLTFNALTSSWAEQNYRWNDRFLQAAFPWNLFGDENGNVFVLGERDSHDGAAFASYARTGRISLGSTRAKGVLTRVYPFAGELPAASYPLEVYAHAATQVSGDTTEHGPYDFDLTQQGRHFVPIRVVARYAELEFRSYGAGAPWSLSGWKIDVASAGER